MSIFDFWRSSPKSSAATAKERLQILMAHERVEVSGRDYLPMLHKELVAVIAKYVQIDAQQVEVKLERRGGLSMLEVNIELPVQGDKAGGTAQHAV